MSAVEWKKLGDVCEVHTGEQLNRNDMVDNGQFPVINGGKEPSGYTNSFNEQANSITISQGGESAGFVNWIDKDFWAGAHCYVVEENENTVKKFLYYSLKNIEIILQSTKQGAGIPGLNRKKLYEQIIPIPSLAKQQEIVSHLDTFTTLISNLESELDMRRKQYEHYCNQLLDFEGVEDVEWKALKNIANFRNGKGHEKSIDSEGSYIIVNSKFISTNGLVKKYCNVQISPLYKDDILMVMSDLPNGKALARCYLVDIDNKYTLNQRICALNVKDESIVRTKYLYIILNRNKQLLEYDNGVDQTNLRKDDILNIHIPIPSLAAQQEIVEKLDAFENLIQSLEQEIKLRKQQYEYYREKLLTFEKE